MVDFIMISTRAKPGGIVEIYPKFIMKKSNDLMIRGGDFYAIWIEERGLWSTDEQDLIDIIDRELDRYAEAHKDKIDGRIRVLHLWDAETGMIDAWHKYCQKQCRDCYNPLDEKLLFANAITDKKDYASKRLGYPLEPGSIDAYDKLMSTLYSEEERHKLEWAIGAIVTGESKYIQKFLVLYGSAGTGKSTVLNIIQQLFDGYYSVFDARALGSATNVFALEAFKTNPLVAIQHDGDLSRIEDNTRLNSLVSHELMTVNEKFKQQYQMRFNSFLFMGTNKPVKITDAKSGLIRRLIDVSPTGNKLDPKEYTRIMKQIGFELGAIACHCRDVYYEDPGYYDSYTPKSMMGASNDFYNFVLDSYHVFVKTYTTTRKAAWEMYKVYCEDARVPYPLPLRSFTEELKNYFWKYHERYVLEDGSRVRSYYMGFRTDIFDEMPEEKKEPELPEIVRFKDQESIFDVECRKFPAQYGTSKETPSTKWLNCQTTLAEIDTTQLHFVKVPENHVVIDFDIRGEDGEKSLERNIEEASKWPPTYAELSKSGKGIHLHYIYTGDVTKLEKLYAEHIEVKIFSGNSSLRRKLTKCNNLPIATISSGLPLKGGDKLVNFDAIRSEKGLRRMIERNLRKEIHPGTKPSIDFIYQILEETYARGLTYDVSDMYNAIVAFAANSTNQADYCLKLVDKMKFKSDEPSENKDSPNEDLVFFDVEVFPNLFLVNWKYQGKDRPVVRMINPTPLDIEDMLKMRLVGFNCRRYDNHILYARLMGYDNEQLYNLSQKIISGDKNAFFGEAYNISYTDVYDFSSVKQSLKKFEIELGIHHQELGLPWDQPVPEERWLEVAEYCDNDVIATEAVFEARQADFIARQILADITGMTVNDTTNSLSTRFIFGSDRNPQSQFNYRDMGEITDDCDRFTITEDGVLYNNVGDEFTVFNSKGQPVFPGYKYEFGKSTYRGEEVGEGGYVYAEPGIYTNVALLDIASMHPASVIAEMLFGLEYTARFQELRDARIAIKHKDFDTARKMLNGVLAKYLDNESNAKALAGALKIVINSVYGLTSAKFSNPFRDPRNKDNIVAKRGALFMINLKHEVQKRGFTVAHIKTDSIKIPDATPDIIEFVMDYGKMYGYTFEHEDTYDRMCLVNDAVYIAKYKEPHTDDNGNKVWWTATGTQFQVPYVFKTLFSREPIEFSDMCETKSTTSALYLDFNEPLPDVSEYESVLAIRHGNRPYESLSKKEMALINLFKDISDEELDKAISEGHAYQFVGKVGNFCPVKEGCGGGTLLREKDGKYYAVGGSKGYRWLESEVVRLLGRENDIDRSYYERLVDEAAAAIGKYGNVESFISDGPYCPPPWMLPCGDTKRTSCEGCPHFHNDLFHRDCRLGHDISTTF